MEAKQKPGKVKICKYAILRCLLDSRRQLDIETLHGYTGFDTKLVVVTIGRLLTYQDIAKDSSKKRNEYLITKIGQRKLKYFERNNFSTYWKPSYGVSL